MGRSDEPNQSWWMTSEPPAARAPLEQDLRVDVVVVGGGITGLATARELQDRGADVAVVEADRLASGSTGFTTAKVTSLHGLPYRDLIDRHGEHHARLYGEANQWAIDRIASMGEVERLPAFTFTTDPERVPDIEADVDAARSIGLPASLVAEDIGLPFPVAAAVRFDDQALVHPRRLAQRIAYGLTVYEQTRVFALEESSEGVQLKTSTGATIDARCAVLATLLPFDDIGGFFAKTEPVRSYAMAVRVPDPGAALGGMFLGVDSPTRSVRPLRFDDGDVGLVVGGNGHRVGEEPDTEGRYAELEAWARSTFGATSVEARWSAQDYAPVDHLPYIGRSPRRRHTFVATGFRKWGMTTGVVAGRILADAVTDAENPWSEVFDSTRIDVGGSLEDFLKTNAHIVKPFVQGHVGPKTKKCTHLGCTVSWNEAESSWDCPCHGSRFDGNGEVLEGPAVEPLAGTPVSVDASAEK